MVGLGICDTPSWQIRSLECSLRLLSSPANSNDTETYPFSPPRISCPVDVTSSTFIVDYCLSALV